MNNSENTGIYKSIYLKILIAVIVLISMILIYFYVVYKIPHEILINNKVIVNTNSLKAAKKIVNEAIDITKGNSSLETKISQKISYRRSSKSNIANEKESVKLIADNISTEAQLYVILSNDEPVAAFRTYNMAQETLKKLKEKYNKLPGVIKGNPEFKETVTIKKQPVSVSIAFDSINEAVESLSTYKHPPFVHIVKKGEHAWDIARKYDISISDIMKLNPGADMNLIEENQQLLIKPGVKPINVITKRYIILETEMALPQDVYRHSKKYGGKRTTKTLMTYENSQPVDSIVISQVTTWKRPKIKPYRRIKNNAKTDVPVSTANQIVAPPAVSDQITPPVENNIP